MPCNDNDDGELFHTLDLIAKMTYFLNGALSRQVTFFMTEADACILLPEMVTPQVPLDLLDESVTDVLLNLAVGRFCHSLKLPPFESNDGKVKRLK